MNAAPPCSNPNRIKRHTHPCNALLHSSLATWRDSQYRTGPDTRRGRNTASSHNARRTNAACSYHLPPTLPHPSCLELETLREVGGWRSPSPSTVSDEFSDSESITWFPTDQSTAATWRSDSKGPICCSLVKTVTVTREGRGQEMEMENVSLDAARWRHHL